MSVFVKNDSRRLSNFLKTHIFWNFDYISRNYNQINYWNIGFAKVIIILIMTAQVPFFDVFSEKDLHLNAVEIWNTDLQQYFTVIDVFIDNEWLLLVGKKLKNSSLNSSLKHPVLLPKKHQVTYMIITWSHKKVTHGGKRYTIKILRNSRFWVINATSACRRVIFKYVICQRLRSKLRLTQGKNRRSLIIYLLWL